MKNENIIINIKGIKAADIGKDLIQMEVEADDRLASMFKLWLPMKPKTPGKLTYIDDDRLKPGVSISIDVGFNAGVQPLIEGYITHMKPRIVPDPAQCVLEVWGMDRSILMDRQEVLKDWPNKKDSDIAREILTKYGFIPKVEDTKNVHNEKVSTIIQRETDMQFLKRLAERNGFLCYVENKTGYFEKPRLKQDRTAVLDFKFDEQGVLIRFDANFDGLSATRVKMFQVDRLNKKVMSVSVTKSDLKRLGMLGPENFQPQDKKLPLVYTGMNAVTNETEMRALCTGMVQESEFFVTAEGDVAGNKLGKILSPGNIVIVSGVGNTYSGYYYLSQVNHSFSPEGYIQHFKARRNALIPRGVEKLTSTRTS
jgi:phage protein D